MTDPASEEHKEFVKSLFKHEPKTLWTLSAIANVIQHWVETENLIEEAAKKQVELHGPKWDPKDSDGIGEFLHEVNVARDFQDQTMKPIHRYSCIVMLCTTVERELKRLVENIEAERGKQKLKVSDIERGSYCDRVNKYLYAFFNIKISDCPQFEAIKDLQKVRNCIVHYQGEAGLMADKDRDYLVNLGSKRKGFHAFEHPNIEIDIRPVCIQQFATESWEFFVWIFNTLKWEIDSHYRGNQLEEHFKLMYPSE